MSIFTSFYFFYMLYTHLNLSILPIFIWILFFFLFNFLCYFFWFYWFFWVFMVLIIVLYMLFFTHSYSSSLTGYSFIQFFCNSQFFIYFVVWEVFFFFGIFWSLFWVIFSYDSCFILSLNLINPFGLALLNTFLLLSSSTFGVLFHLNYLNFKYDNNLFLCIIFGFFFIVNQYLEFNLCFYTIWDYAFCSVFFLGTGFHGFHVLVGVIFLILNLIYFSLNRFYLLFFLNCSLLYWHFVDIIWLFLFWIIYCIVFNLYL